MLRLAETKCESRVEVQNPIVLHERRLESIEALLLTPKKDSVAECNPCVEGVISIHLVTGCDWEYRGARAPCQEF